MTVACVRSLVATYLGLGRVVVRGGAAVSPGDVLGTVAASHLQLGARRAGDRNGYVDPLTLLRGESPPPLGAAPRAARRPRVDAPRRLRPPRPVAVPRTSPSPSPRPVAVPRLVPSPSRSPSPRAVAAPRFPLPAWIGLGLVAAGMPLGAFVRGRRRRRVASLPRRAAARAP